MFKKKYLVAAGFAVLAIAVMAGCGKKSSTESVIEATPTPAAETPTPTPELVNMEATTEENVMGEKTSTSSKVTITNQTGTEISAIYIRETPSDDSDDTDEWGDDLINGSFTLKNGEKAVYYYEKLSSSTTYDIRVSYKDEDQSEYFFRKLPLASISQITLRVNGTDDDAIPYATYKTTTGSSEVSTLKEVKERLGMDTSDDDSDNADTDTVTPTPSESDTSNSSSDDNSNSSDSSNGSSSSNSSDNNSSDDNTDPTNSDIQIAEQYIGMSIEDLQGQIGSSSSSEYSDDDATGTSGYYYYGDFTVSTSVDEDGNEVVTGVW